MQIDIFAFGVIILVVYCLWSGIRRHRRGKAYQVNYREDGTIDFMVTAVNSSDPYVDTHGAHSDSHDGGHDGGSCDGGHSGH